MSSLSVTRARVTVKYPQIITALILITLLLTFLLPDAARAATAPTLGVAGSFAVLGGSTVTNTGPSTINGDLGVAPGNTAPGTQNAVISGTRHLGNAIATQAQEDLTTAYNALRSQPCAPAQDLTGQDLGGKTLTAGTYCFSSSAQLTGTVTLDAQGDAGAVFIFKIASTLTTASNSRVLLINGGSPCNVFWQVGSSATIGTTTTFVGNIVALTSITLNNGANIAGRALARNGAVTLDTNTISFAACSGAPAAAPPATMTPPPITTPPASQPSATPTVTPAFVNGPALATATPVNAPATNVPSTNAPAATATPAGSGSNPSTATPRPAQPASPPEETNDTPAPAATPTPLAATPTPVAQTPTPNLVTPTPTGTGIALTPSPGMNTPTATRPLSTPTFGPTVVLTPTVGVGTATPVPVLPNLPKTGSGGMESSQTVLLAALVLVILAAGVGLTRQRTR